MVAENDEALLLLRHVPASRDHSLVVCRLFEQRAAKARKGAHVFQRVSTHRDLFGSFPLMVGSILDPV
jgi:hypothetical protein